AHWHGLPARKAFAISSSLKQTCAEPLGIVRSITGGCTQVFGASYYHNWSKPKGDARAYFRLLSWRKRLVKSQEYCNSSRRSKAIAVEDGRKPPLVKQKLFGGLNRF